jgi:hypothetical protein
MSGNRRFRTLLDQTDKAYNSNSVDKQLISVLNNKPRNAPLVVPEQPYYVTHPDSSVTEEKGLVQLISGEKVPVGKLISLAVAEFGPVAATWAKNKLIQAGKDLYKYGTMTRKPRTSRPSRSGYTQIPKTVTVGSKGGGKQKKVKIYGQTATATYAPVGISTTIGARKRKPRIVNMNDGSVVVSHSEMIGTLVSSGTTLTYKVDSYVANPGKPSIFPWLSTIATNYDKYRFRKLYVCLISSQPTSTAGRIGIGFDYDSTDPTPANRIEFFSLSSHVEATPWQSIELDIPVEGGLRFTNTHTTTDSKLIDLGQLLLMSDQIVATTAVLADVIVSYEVELHHPQQAIFNTQSFISLTDSGATSVGPAFVTQAPNATTPASIVDFTVPQGSWEVTVKFNIAGITGPTGTPSSVFANMPTGYTSDNAVPTAATLLIGVYRFDVTEPSRTLRFDTSRFSATVAVSTLTGVRIFFSRVSPRLASIP